MQQEPEYENQEHLEGQEEENFMSYEELVDAKKITISDIKEHLTGPVISVIVHIIVLAFVGTIIVFQAPDEKDELIVTMKKVEPPDMKEPPPPPPEPPKPVETEVDNEVERPEVPTDPAVEVSVDEQITFTNTDVQIDIPNVLSVKPTNSALKMPALMASRTGNGRKGAIKAFGGSDKTELAVLRALRWLKYHQNSDGSWGETKRGDMMAYTGMALLCFLAHGDTASSTEFGDTVQRAIQKLVEYVGPDANKVKGGYRHAICMYALSEAYALTRIPMLKEIMNKGIDRIVKGMNSAGSFNYGYNNSGGRCDLSVSGWNYQALKAAFAAGCTTEGLEDAIHKGANTGLKKTHWSYAKKMFGYGANGSGTKPTMTAVGVLCLQLYGEGKSNEATQGLETLESPKYFWFSWDPQSEGKVSGWALYQWYYQTQAIFQGNSGTGGSWTKWNNMFKSELLKQQKIETVQDKITGKDMKIGSWVSPAYAQNPAKGGHGEAMFKGIDQPVYATSLCCLMLEVYYRYLPTFKVAHIRVVNENGGGADAEDDVGLKLKTN